MSGTPSELSPRRVTLPYRVAFPGGQQPSAPAPTGTPNVLSPLRGTPTSLTRKELRRLHPLLTPSGSPNEPTPFKTKGMPKPPQSLLNQGTAGHPSSPANTQAPRHQPYPKGFLGHPHPFLLFEHPSPPDHSRSSRIPSHPHGPLEASSGHSPGLRQLSHASPSSLLQREEAAVSGARSGNRTGTKKGTVPTSAPGSSRSESAASPPSLPR